MKILTDKAHKEEKLDSMHQTGTKVSFTPIDTSYQELNDKTSFITPINKSYQELNDKTQCPPLTTNVTATLIAG